MMIRSLFEFSDDTGKIMFPSQHTMGELVGRAERTARRYCAELRKLGFLEERAPQTGPKFNSGA